MDGSSGVFRSTGGFEAPVLLGLTPALRAVAGVTAGTVKREVVPAGVEVLQEAL